MKILLLSPNTKEAGGIQRYANETVRALRLLHHKVWRIELIRSSLIHKVIFIIKTLYLLPRFRPDVIMCMHINLSPICLLTQKILSIPYIVVAHGTDVWNITRSTRTQGIKNASGIISVSSFTTNKLKHQIAGIEKRIFSVPCPVDEKKFYIQNKNDHLAERYNCKNKYVLFTLSRISRDDLDKGYERVLSAMPEIRKYIPEIVYIIGGSGDYALELRGKIQKLGLEPYVKLAGHIPEQQLIDYYNLADVFVMPSKQEGFGIVFLEALACGVPVIAGNDDGSQDAVLGGNTGVLIDPDDTHELAKAIISVLEKNVPKHLVDPQYLRSTTLEQYSIDRFTKRLGDVIYSLRR